MTEPAPTREELESLLASNRRTEALIARQIADPAPHHDVNERRGMLGRVREGIKELEDCLAR